jgi:hypothetical protein
MARRGLAHAAEYDIARRGLYERLIGSGDAAQFLKSLDPQILRSQILKSLISCVTIS